MQESPAARDAWIRFCDRLSATDVAAFDELVSAAAVLIVGTAPGELITERDRMRFGFEAEGAGIDPSDPLGYEEGGMAFTFDEPQFSLPDGSSFPARVTAVWTREHNSWKLVHAHFSAGVPDDRVVEIAEA